MVGAACAFASDSYCTLYALLRHWPVPGPSSCADHALSFIGLYDSCNQFGSY